MASTDVWVCYTVCSVVVVLFGAFACAFTFYRKRRNAAKETTEFFLTARRSVGWFFIAWSFFAGAMGSWTLFSPASYGYFTEVLGLAMYALASGFPLLMIAFLGGVVHRLVPNVLSFSDFVKRRFGTTVMLYISALTLFNMGVALTAEYTAVGDLFNIVIGSVRWPIVVIIGVVAAIYTAYGGLYVSIITDQVQAFAAIFMIIVLFIFVCVTGKSPNTPLPKYLGATFQGYSSIAVMPISLAASTVFSEAMWQRCWATVDKRQLHLGGLVGSIAVTLCVFILGFGGIYAAWTGLYVPSGPDDAGNTILFSLLDNVNGGRHTIIMLVVSILSVSMSTSAIDSLQNAIVDNISGVYLRRAPLIWVRLLVLVLNVPPMIVSLKSYNIIQLFLVANLVTTTSVLPVLAGLIRHRLAYYLVTPFSMLMGCAQGLISIFWWCVIDQQSYETYSQTLKRVFTVEYAYPPFMLALGMSIVGVFFGALVEHGFRALIRRPMEVVDPLADEQLPLGSQPFEDSDEDLKAAYKPKHAEPIDEPLTQ